MKQLLILALCIAPCFPGAFDASAFSCYRLGWETGIIKGPQLKTKDIVNTGEHEAKRLTAAENKDSARVVELYDMILPPACLLLLIGLCLTLQKPEK